MSIWNRRWSRKTADEAIAPLEAIAGEDPRLTAAARIAKEIREYEESGLILSLIVRDLIASGGMTEFDRAMLGLSLEKTEEIGRVFREYDIVAAKSQLIVNGLLDGHIGAVRSLLAADGIALGRKEFSLLAGSIGRFGIANGLMDPVVAYRLFKAENPDEFTRLTVCRPAR